MIMVRSMTTYYLLCFVNKGDHIIMFSIYFYALSKLNNNK